MTHFEFQQFIQRNTWVYAKTYAAFCPHEYVVKEWLKRDDQLEFEQIVAFIRERGFIAIYGRKGPNRYYTVDDYYYWTMGDPVEETNILNRAKLSDYEFHETENGVILVCSTPYSMLFPKIETKTVLGNSFCLNRGRLRTKLGFCHRVTRFFCSLPATSIYPFYGTVKRRIMFVA